jgi:hypothetical protein
MNQRHLYRLVVGRQRSVEATSMRCGLS